MHLSVCAPFMGECSQDDCSTVDKVADILAIDGLDLALYTNVESWSMYSKCLCSPTSASCRLVPDAFAATEDDVDGAGRALNNQKSKKSQRDPSLQQAEQILAAGSDALMLQQ